MKMKFRKNVSFILALTMLVQLMSIGGIMTASATATAQIVDNGADYFAAAKAYGVYTETAAGADGSDLQQGMAVLDLEVKHMLAHVDDTETLEYIDSQMYPNAKASVNESNGYITLGNMKELAFYSKANGIKYVAPNSDGAYMIKSCADKYDMASNAWFTTYNHRIPDKWTVKPVSQNEDGSYNYVKSDGKYDLVPSGYRTIPGFMYFKVTDDTIKDTDANLSVVIEYYDNGTSEIGFVYNGVSATVPTVKRTNTNTWKTAVWTLDDASFSSTNKTSLQEFYEMRFSGSNQDLYIRKAAVVKTADLTASAAEKFDVSETRYFKDGKLSHYSQGGNITTEIDITASIDSKATLYTAVYDANEALVDVAMSASTTLTANTKTTIKTDTAVNVPSGADYTFRKYIWTDNLAPAYSVNPEDALVLSADGFYKLAILKWNEYENINDAVKFNVYRDGKLIGVTDKAAYYDNYASEGTHTYQIAAVDASGNVVYRSNYAVADVVTTIESNVAFYAARKGSSNDILTADANVNLDTKGVSDIKHNFNSFKVSKLFTSDEALQIWTPEDILAPADRNGLSEEQMISKIKDYKYVSASSDGPISTETVTDYYGVTKDAFYSHTFYRVNTKYYGWSKMYLDLADGVCAGKNNVTVFVEYLATEGAASSINLNYANTQSADLSGNQYLTPKFSAKSVSHNILKMNGPQWITARFDLTDANLGYRYKDNNGDMFINAGGGVYLSSIFVTDKTGNDALVQYAKYKGSNFGYATQEDAEALYPDGVSISFDANGQVNNGIRWFEDGREVADAYTTVETDGTDYYVQQGRAVRDGNNRQSYIYFEVDDNYLFGDKVSEGVYLTLTYKPDFNGRIFVQTTGCDGGNKVVVIKNGITADPDTPWVTETFFLEDVMFVNKDNASCDFRITTDNGDCDNSLKIKELKIQSLNHKER